MEQNTPPSIGLGPAALPAALLANALRVGKLSDTAVRTKPRAVAYLRRSKKIENDSIERQEERAKAYAEKIGVDLAHCYIDRSISGEVARRKAFQEMIADGKEGAFTIVIVEAVDRIGRTMSSIAMLYDTFTKLGIAIHTLETEAPIAAIDVAFRGFLAAEHQTLLRARIGAGKRRLVLNGGIASIPYGYKKVPEKPGERVIDEDTRHFIEWMFEAKIGGMTFAQIAHAANDMGTHKAPNSKKWSYHVVRGILRNTIYAGLLTHYKTKATRDPETDMYVVKPTHPSNWIIIELPHLAIVSREVWQASYDTFKVLGEKLRNSPSFLAAKIRCTHCGQIMHAQRTGDQRYAKYYCRVPFGDGDATYTCNSVRVKTANELVLGNIRTLLEDGNLQRRYLAEVAARHKKASATLEKRRRELTQRRDWLTNALNAELSRAIEADFPLDVLKARTRGHTDEYHLVQAQLADMPLQVARRPIDVGRIRTLLAAFDDLTNAITKQATAFEKPTPEQRQMIETLREMVGTLTCTRNPDTRGITLTATLTPSRIFGLKEADDGAKTLTFTAIEQANFVKRSDDEMIAGFGKGLHAATDAEFAAFLESGGEEFMRKSGCDLETTRYTLDLALFLATTRITFYRLLTQVTEAKMKPIGRALAVMTNGKTCTVWANFLVVLKRQFPKRYATLQLDHLQKPNTYRYARKH